MGVFRVDPRPMKNGCLYNHEIVKTKTHYVSVDGREFDISTHSSHGYGGVYRGMLDLPADGYPYSFRYKTSFKWLSCSRGECGYDHR